MVVESEERTSFEIDTKDLNCDGLASETIESRSCTIPIANFRNKYHVDYPDRIYAKIRSLNVNGWSLFSQTSLSSALVVTEPIKM